MELLQSIFIAPLSLLMQLILEQAFAVVGEYGLSIIILSLAVNLLMIPLYQIAEKLDQKERQIQSVLQPKIIEIKKNSRGEERFKQISQLYKEHRYHPIQSLRSSLGFFIQVPFFIAAYLLLISYTPFQGVSFFLVNDLSKPDQILNIAGLDVNVLPVIMTLINLGSLYFFEAVTASETLKLLALAFFFLVILYTAPAAAVLYWTINNCWSLGRGAFFTKRT